ncbi:MAG: DUF1851 domain-containing protein [Gammaproteobacteria bacterium]|nr:MAG: DUF1851 domain-containing protein [Gammaproteobacteria bacterium]
MLDKYILDQSQFDWSTILKTWHWLLPTEFTVWFMNRFGDLFIVTDNGSVCHLHMDDGVYNEVAANKDLFSNVIDEGNNANEWLYIPLVDKLVSSEVHLQESECYGFIKPPVVGGDYTLENIKPISVSDYISYLGTFYEQIRDLPDGAKIEFRVTD